LWTLTCPVENTLEGYKRKLCVTKEFVSSANHRDYLFRIHKRGKLLADFEKYEKFRNHLTHVKQLSKRKYHEDQFVKNRKKSKGI